MGAHYYIRWRNTVTDDVTKLGRIVECQANDVRAIRINGVIEGKPQELAFERLDHPIPGIPPAADLEQWQWKMSSPLAGVADPALIRRIASALCELYDPIPVRSSDFRLGPEEKKLEATLATSVGEAKVHFEFGVLSRPSTVIRYFGFGQERTVRIPDLFLETISLPIEKYRNKKVLNLDADNIQRATLKVEGKERFTLERAGGDWKVFQNGKEKGAGNAEAGKFVNRISTLEAIEIVAEGFYAPECNSLKANALVQVQDVLGKVSEIRFAYSPNSDLTACSTRGSQKFRIHRDFLPYLDISTKNVLPK
jgi:hypothetical protein